MCSAARVACGSMSRLCRRPHKPQALAQAQFNDWLSGAEHKTLLLKGNQRLCQKNPAFIPGLTGVNLGSDLGPSVNSPTLTDRDTTSPTVPRKPADRPHAGRGTRKRVASCRCNLRVAAEEPPPRPTRRDPRLARSGAAPAGMGLCRLSDKVSRRKPVSAAGPYLGTVTCRKPPRLSVPRQPVLSSTEGPCTGEAPDWRWADTWLLVPAPAPCVSRGRRSSALGEALDIGSGLS